MPTIEAVFEIWCAVCGDGLCNNVNAEHPGYHPSASNPLIIDPCEKCLDAAREEGYQKGYQEAADDADTC